MVQILCTDISQIDDILYRCIYEAASFDRQQRADSYRNKADSVRCIVAEVLLRTALVRHFGHWEGFRFFRAEHGKPYLQGQDPFYFSISHSGNWVALAYGETELGLDIQQINAVKARAAVAARFFTPDEQLLLAQNNSTEMFTRIWTGKESYLKYLGAGLARALTSFSILSPEDGLHYFWETLDGHILCLCTQENTYQMEEIHIKNAPA